MSDPLARISKAVIEGNLDDITNLTKEALNSGLGAKDILDNGLIPGLDHVGERFKYGDMFMPEVLLSARVMHASLSILKPKFAETGAKMIGKVVIGTVKGDLHDVGKNLVGMMLEGGGFEVYDLGKDAAPEAFVEAVKDRKPDIVGMSALLTTTMGMMQETVDALAEAGIREQVKIMVGGAPVTAEFAEQVGADGYGPDAMAAVDLAREFVGV